MPKSVKATILFALAASLSLLPAIRGLELLMTLNLATRLAVWSTFASYAFLLTRLGRVTWHEVFFPAALLLGAALWPGTRSSFLVLALALLSWARSGICFTGTPLRSLAAELVCAGGGAALVACLAGGMSMGWPPGIFLFFLVQSLYFFFLPQDSRNRRFRATEDRFERACREAERRLGCTP